jgi:hypothetical protein
MCAALGLDATGVDLAAKRFRPPAELRRGLSARFLHLDARDLDRLDGPSTPCWTAGCSVFDPDARPAYICRSPPRLLPGARYFISASPINSPASGSLTG